jgi:hypothetical protein
MATVFTNTGRVQLVNALDNTQLTAPVHIGWGTGTTGAAVGDTTLETPASEARVSGTKSKEETNFADDTYQVVGTITAEGTKTISEAGLFNASSDGTMYVRGDFTGIALEEDDSIAFTIKVVVA